MIGTIGTLHAGPQPLVQEAEGVADAPLGLQLVGAGDVELLLGQASDQVAGELAALGYSVRGVFEVDGGKVAARRARPRGCTSTVSPW